MKMYLIRNKQTGEYIYNGDGKGISKLDSWRFVSEENLNFATFYPIKEYAKEDVKLFQEIKPCELEVLEVVVTVLEKRDL